MASLKLIGLLVLAAVSCADAQAIRANAFPKAGDICKDYGESWRGLYLGPCEANTFCRAYKRGVFKCVYNDGVKVPGTNLPGVMSIGTECYDEDKVNNDEKQKTKTAPGGTTWRDYYKRTACEFKGLDKQGTPLVQCVQTANKKKYNCGYMPTLGKQGCATVAGSMIWGKYNDNQAYDMCNGCPCTPPGIKGKYPLCQCDQPCTAQRQQTRCPTD